MVSRAWMMNLCLAAVAVFLGIKAYGVWSEEQAGLPKADIAKGKGAMPVSMKTFGRMHVPPESEYDAIVNHDLFSVARSAFSKGKKEGELEVKGGPDERVLKLLEATIQQISIYGVMIVDGEKRALIGSPAMSVSEGRKRMLAPHAGEAIKWVKVGEGLNRFTVNDITSTGVVLGAEGMAFDVALYDTDKPKNRAPIPKEAGPIVVGGDAIPGAAAESGVAKETKKEQSPVPADAAKSLVEEAQKKFSGGMAPPKLGDFKPEAVPRSMRTRLLPNRPSADQR
jgi:hypothetical protein